MDCRAVRRILRETPSLARLSPRISGARSHLSRCAICQTWEAAERSWRSALREKLPSLETPVPLKERLFSGIAEQRVGSRTSPLRPIHFATLVVTAIAVAILVGLSTWPRRAGDRLLVPALVEDHLVYANRADPAELCSNDPAEIAAWLSGRIDFAPSVPSLHDSNLLGGRLCTVADHRVALAFYDHAGARVSLFEMVAERLPDSAFRRRTVLGRQFGVGHHKGVSVVAWHERGILFALVSALPEARLLELTTGGVF